MGKRDNSLLWVITTAGSNRAGIGYEARTFVTQVLQGVVSNDSQFGIIYGLDDEDDWTSEAALIKANPNWGVSVQPKVVLRLQAKAKQLPAAVNTFKTKHLNEWSAPMWPGWICEPGNTARIRRFHWKISKASPAGWD